VLDAIPERKALLRRLSTSHSRFAALGTYQNAGGRVFFTRRDAGADDFDLLVRDGDSARKLVDLHRLRAANGAAAYAINYFLASPDGSKVAVGISKGGTENAQLRIYDARTGSAIGDSIDRTEFGFLAWSDDSTTIYMNRLRPPSAGQMERYTDSTVDAWDLHSAPRTIVDRSLLSAAGLAATDTPQLILSATSTMAALRIQNGAEQNIAIWLAPKADVGSPRAWRPFVSHRDGVTAFELSGTKMFLLSNDAAPTFKILELDMGMPLSSARTILSADLNRIIESIHAASDGLYVVVRRGLYAAMLLIRPVQELKLPTEGRISAAFSNPERPGVTIASRAGICPQRSMHTTPRRTIFPISGWLRHHRPASPKP
jgi:prolyl oligopeptidase